MPPTGRGHSHTNAGDPIRSPRAGRSLILFAPTLGHSGAANGAPTRDRWARAPTKCSSPPPSQTSSPATLSSVCSAGSAGFRSRRRRLRRGKGGRKIPRQDSAASQKHQPLAAKQLALQRPSPRQPHPPRVLARIVRSRADQSTTQNTRRPAKGRPSARQTPLSGARPGRQARPCPRSPQPAATSGQSRKERPQGGTSSGHRAGGTVF